MLSVLLKKQLTEKLSVFKKNKKSVDWLGLLLTLILVGGLIAVCVWVLQRFITVYCAIRIDGITDVSARQFEILTVVYAVLIVLGVINGIRAINFAVFENDDRNILITLPIKSSTIFYSKLITVYVKQFAVYFITLLPVNLTFAVVTEQSAYYVFMTILACFVFPVLTLALASVFCLPVYYVKRFVRSQHTTSLLITTAVTGLLFWCYSSILSFVQTLMTTGEIRFFFKEETMNAIIKTTNGLYPANVFARVILKINTGANVGILIAIVVVAAVVGFFIVNLLYNKANQMRTVSSARFTRRARGAGKTRPQLVALIGKEFGLVFRTPSYAFQYFSVAAVMPLMVYFCMGIGSDMLSSLILSQNNFELALFLVLIFGALTNTFCATNISREGPAFYTLKTMPIKFERIIAAKILFCTLIAAVSTAVTCIMLAALNYISWGAGAYVFFVAILLAEAQICFATRKDLNRPSFSADEDCEVKESNNTISEIIVAGMLVAAVLGGVSLYLSIIKGSVGESSSAATMLFTGLSAAAVFAASLLYTFIGLKKKFYNLTEGN